MIRLKRVYEEPSRRDGFRVLVDRLWPRGLTKQRAAIEMWLKETAPTTELRKWFAHDPAKWKKFESRYRKELVGKKDSLVPIAKLAKKRTVTLVYAARDEKKNEAVVLKKYLERGLK